MSSFQPPFQNQDALDFIFLIIPLLSSLPHLKTRLLANFPSVEHGTQAAFKASELCPLSSLSFNLSLFPFFSTFLFFVFIKNTPYEPFPLNTTQESAPPKLNSLPFVIVFVFTAMLQMDFPLLLPSSSYILSLFFFTPLL